VDLASIHQPVLVMNGESDKMVPTKNTVDLDRRLPNSQLVVYPDAGHGGVFQFHEDFVKRALEFLATVWPHGSSRASCSRVNPRSRSPTVARLQSEEGLIIGISFAPALHD
jgi:alpha/beta hydrolase fold